MNVLAIDIGGTTIKSDVYSKGQSLNFFKEIPTNVDLNAQTNGIMKQVEELIEDTINSLNELEQPLDGVSIATAGVVDTSQGKVIYAGYTIPNYSQTDFKTMIQDHFDLPCIVLNDVNSATYAEYKSNKDYVDQTLVCLTLGTGIGSGIVVNGQLLIGSAFTAGEIGYMPINGEKYQDIASTTALVKDYQKVTDNLKADGKILFEAYKQGDELSKQVVTQWIDRVVEGLLPMIYILNPGIIALGGGIMAQHEILLPQIKDRLKRRLESSTFMPSIVKEMNVGNEAGRLGAYYYFLDYVNP